MSRRCPDQPETRTADAIIRGQPFDELASGIRGAARDAGTEAEAVDREHDDPPLGRRAGDRLGGRNRRTRSSRGRGRTGWWRRNEDRRDDATTPAVDGHAEFFGAEARYGPAGAIDHLHVDRNGVDSETDGWLLARPAGLAALVPPRRFLRPGRRRARDTEGRRLQRQSPDERQPATPHDLTAVSITETDDRRPPSRTGPLHLTVG